MAGHKRTRIDTDLGSIAIIGPVHGFQTSLRRTPTSAEGEFSTDPLDAMNKTLENLIDTDLPDIENLLTSDTRTILPKAGEETARPRVFGFLGSKKYDFNDFHTRWVAVQKQIGTMLNDIAAQSFGDMCLDTLEVSIGISVEGNIGIASSKADASMVLTFKQKAPQDTKPARNSTTAH
jgi:hypothetical protein